MQLEKFSEAEIVDHLDVHYQNGVRVRPPDTPSRMADYLEAYDRAHGLARRRLGRGSMPGLRD